MFVVHFNQHARFALPDSKPFTGMITELETAISGFDLGGTTALYDAILLAQSQFKRAAYGRKILLVITDGGDNSSKASLAEVLDALVKSEAVVFPIGIFDAADRDREPARTGPHRRGHRRGIVYPGSARRYHEDLRADRGRRSPAVHAWIRRRPRRPVSPDRSDGDGSEARRVEGPHAPGIFCGEGAG